MARVNEKNQFKIYILTLKIIALVGRDKIPG